MGSDSGDKPERTDEPEHVRKLFIGGLNFKTTTETLKKYYSQWGELTDCVVMKDPKTGKPRGFGFVTYATSAQLEKCQKERPHLIDGRSIEPIRAQPRHCHRLYVAGVKGPVEEKDLRKYFGTYGRIYSVEIAINKKTGEKRGFAFIEFDDYDPVDKIVMHKSHFIRGKRIDVKKALSKEEIAKFGPDGRDGRGGPNFGGGWGGSQLDFDDFGPDFGGPPRGGWGNGPNFNDRFGGFDGPDFGPFDGPDRGFDRSGGFGGGNFGGGGGNFDRPNGGNRGFNRGNDWGNNFDGPNNSAGWGDGPNRRDSDFGGRGGRPEPPFRDNFDNSRGGGDDWNGSGNGGNRGYTSVGGGRGDWGNDSGPLNDSPQKRGGGWGDDGPRFGGSGSRNFSGDGPNGNFGGSGGGFDEPSRNRGSGGNYGGGSSGNFGGGSGGNYGGGPSGNRGDSDWNGGNQGSGYKSAGGDWGGESNSWRGGSGPNRGGDNWADDNDRSGYRSSGGGPMKSSGGGFGSSRPTPYGGGNSNNSFKPQIAGPTGRRF